MCEPVLKSVFEREPLAELYRQLRLGSLPLLRRPLPFRLDLAQSQEDQLDRRVIAREVLLVADGLAHLAVQTLDGVGGVEDLADLGREREEGDDLLPLAPPAGDDGRVLLAPGAFFEHVQGCRSGLGTGCGVDRLQVLGDRLALLPGCELHRVADQVDDASLDDGIREHGRDRLREALEAIDDGDQHVRRAAAADLRHHAHPELGPLGLLDPQPEQYDERVRQQ